MENYEWIYFVCRINPGIILELFHLNKYFYKFVDNYIKILMNEDETRDWILFFMKNDLIFAFKRVNVHQFKKHHLCYALNKKVYLSFYILRNGDLLSLDPDFNKLMILDRLCHNRIFIKTIEKYIDLDFKIALFEKMESIRKDVEYLLNLILSLWLSYYGCPEYEIVTELFGHLIIKNKISLMDVIVFCQELQSEAPCIRPIPLSDTAIYLLNMASDLSNY